MGPNAHLEVFRPIVSDTYSGAGGGPRNNLAESNSIELQISSGEITKSCKELCSMPEVNTHASSELPCVRFEAAG